MASEDEMAGWHHHFNGHEFGPTLRDGDGQRGWRAIIYKITMSQT